MKITFRSRIVSLCCLFALFAVVLVDSPSGAVGGFGDVEDHEYYADAVQWLVDEGLTTGTSDGCFSPDRHMSRGEMATFIWRYAGSPPTAPHPFTDVPSAEFFAQAVGWMYSAGLTTGTSPTTYEPERLLTRSEVATFLWRYDGFPDAPVSSFVDVSSDAFYAPAVDWMLDAGITTGTSASTFSPLRELTRAEFATFLYRYSGSPDVIHSGGGTCVASGESAGGLFAEDFVDGGSKSRFDFGIYHRGEIPMTFEDWLGDHPVTGPNDECGPPEQKRVVHRGERANGFNDEWIYRCVPGGDLGKAHLMTSIGDTAPYSIGGFAPAEEFVGVREVRWDVNLTDLGGRQWVEVAIVPADVFDFQNLPCASWVVDCGTANYFELGAVGAKWDGAKARYIVTLDDSYQQAHGDPGYNCETCPQAAGRYFGFDYAADDPALTSLRIRRHNYFRDNGDGTLTWGLELQDGSFDELTVPGSFPHGPVRVVFKDHNYTPTKDVQTRLPELTFTWHWDNIAVFG